MMKSSLSGSGELNGAIEVAQWGKWPTCHLHRSNLSCRITSFGVIFKLHSFRGLGEAPVAWHSTSRQVAAWQDSRNVSTRARELCETLQ